MTALEDAFRLRLGGRWRSALVLGALIGLWLGAALALGAGAMRTRTVVARNVAASRGPDLNIAIGGVASAAPLSASEVRALPQVSRAATYTLPALLWLRSQAGVVVSIGGFTPVVSGDPRFGTSVDRLVIRSGRAPSPNRPSEVAVSNQFARHLRVGLGQIITVQGVTLRGMKALFEGRPAPSLPPSIRLRVVGITAANPAWDFLPQPLLILSRGFVRAYPPNRVASVGQIIDVRLRHGWRDAGRFELALRRLPGGAAAEPYPISPIYDRDAHALDVQAWTVLALALAMVLAAILALIQVTIRGVAEQGEWLRLLRAFGLLPRQIVAVALLPGALAAAVALTLAVALEVLLSPLMEFGGARSLEPGLSPGLDVWLSLLIAVVVVAGVLAAGTLACRAELRERRAPQPAGATSRFGLALAGVGLPVAVIAGLRLALSPARPGHTTLARLRLAALGLAIGSLAIGVSVSASAAHLLSTSRLFGQDYDALGATTLTGLGTAAQLETHPGVRAVTAVQVSIAVVDGEAIDVGVLAPLKGSIRIAILAGHPPRGPRQVAMGAATMRSLHVGIGDQVAIVTALHSRRETVVGEAVLPTVSGPSGEIGVASGVITDRAAGQLLFGPFAPSRVLIRADRREVTRLLANPNFGRPQPVTTGMYMRTVSSVAGWGAVVFGVAGLLVLGWAAASITRRHATELALLKAIGLGPRQLAAAVGAAMGWMAALASLGLPVGLAVGRLLWSIVASQEGVVSVPVIPATAALVIPGALAMAAAVAIVPGARVNRLASAQLLRFGE